MFFITFSSPGTTLQFYIVFYQKADKMTSTKTAFIHEKKEDIHSDLEYINWHFIHYNVGRSDLIYSLGG